MTLNQLKYYVEIVRESSFTKAAEKLFVSQSTLSKSIRTLEEEFQIKLINRAAKEFTLTQEGHVFLEYAERILNYYQEQKADKKYCKELEYIFFEHGYFVPSKEIILENPKSPWLKKFEDYVQKNYPGFLKNPYIKNLSAKDKILLALMKRKMYFVMNMLSGARKKKDLLKQNDRR